MKWLLRPRNLIITIVIIAMIVLPPLFGLQVARPFVSVAAEPVIHLGPLAITNSLLTAWVAMLILIVVSYFATRRLHGDLSNKSNAELVPTPFESAMEWLVEGFYRLVKETSGSWARRFFPIVMTIFLWVIVSNYIGLIPGVGSIGIITPAQGTEGTGQFANGPFLSNMPAPAGQGYIMIPLLRSPSADLNFTIALALVAVVLTQYYGVKALGPQYFRRFFDTSGFKFGGLVGGAQFGAGLLELVGEFAKILSFSFRLFGNIFAGEVLLAVMAFLVPYVVTLPFLGLEVFVGFIQAVVFMMLTLAFLSNATLGHATESVTGHEVEAHH